MMSLTLSFASGVTSIFFCTETNGKDAGYVLCRQMYVLLHQNLKYGNEWLFMSNS